MASEPLMTDRDTVDTKWARENPESAFWWAHEMYFVPSDARISVQPFVYDGFYVYQLIDHTGSVCYVGQSVALCERLFTHMAQSYGEQVEFVMAARCDSREQMDMVESTLITGWKPPLNKQLKCHADGTTKTEVDRLAESMHWELVWGFGTMFWPTTRVIEHVASDITPSFFDGLHKQYEGKLTKKAMVDTVLSMSDDELAAHASVRSSVWGPSMRFLFDGDAYALGVDKIASTYRDVIRDWAKKSRSINDAMIFEQAVAKSSKQVQPVVSRRRSHARKDSVAVTVSMSPQDRDEIREYAKEMGMPLSVLMRVACKEYMLRTR